MTHAVCAVLPKLLLRKAGFENVSIEYTGGDDGWAGDVPKTMLDPSALFDQGFTPNFDSEEAVRHTASTLIQEIGLP